MILIGDVVAEMTVGLLEAQRLDRQQSRKPKPLRAARLQQNREDMPGELASGT